MIATLSIALFLGNSFANADAQALPDAKSNKCTDNPCPNTPMGEDPGVLGARQGKKIEEELRSSPDDKERWAGLIIFSSSTDKAQLTIPIVMASEFSVSLDPRKGWLTFSTPNTSQSFMIGSTITGHDNPCSKYQIRVIDGGSDYALIKKTCPKQEYRPQRFYRGTDYFLYDMKTNTMREIWSASTLFSTAPPFPSAKPELTLKKLPDGYQFDWSGKVVSDNGATSTTIHNRYRRQRDDSGAVTLVCYDVTSPAHPAKENERCESNVLQRVAN